MSFWAISLMLVAFPATFLSIFSLVLKLGTTRIAGDFPAVEVDPHAEWRPCRVVLIGNSRLQSGILDAAADDFGLHCWPAGWAEHLGARPFSIPWEAFGEGMRARRMKGTPLLEATLPNGQRFAADARCFEAEAASAAV
jgi:hypothetical protein